MGITLKKMVSDRLSDLNRNAFNASKIGGLERHFIYEIVIGKKDSVRGDNLQKLAKALDWTVDELMQMLGYDDKTLSPVIASFDPDAPEDIDPDRPTTRRDFPADAIVELLATGGLGDGQIVEEVFTRDGDQIKSSDAIKPDYWRFPSAFVSHDMGARPEALLVISLEGDSMEPTLSAGDRVVANTRHVRPTPDGLYAILDSLGAVVVKRLELTRSTPPMVRIISDNPRHSAYEVRLESITIVGKVVLSLKRF